MLSGSISSSKYSSSASRRLASASSTVPPWLATSTSRQRATCQDPSCVTAAVNRIGTSVRADAAAKFALRQAQLASHNANNALTIEGPVLSLAPRHAKVRRDGYRR
ncbi:MAG: hypothetical protein QOK43_1921 [Acidimicrobiaceae bacterium]|nr:hypothetical protein [Acidimicrobiaceae bacterium]